MRRRAYLATATGLLTTIAGCNTSHSTTRRESTSSAGDTETGTTSSRFPTVTSPEFELASIDAPDTVEISEKSQYSFSVTNTSDQSGTFSTTARTRVEDGSWVETDHWQENLEPGQTTRFRSELFWAEYLSSIDVELSAFDEQFSIQFTPAHPDWGDPHVVPGKYELAARQIRFSDRYTWESGATEYEELPSDGNQWAWVEFAAKNTTNESVTLPRKGVFTLASEGRQYTYTPVRGHKHMYEGGDVQAHAVRDGEILYEIPEGLTRENVSLTYSETSSAGEIAVYWGRGDS